MSQKTFQSSATRRLQTAAESGQLLFKWNQIESLKETALKKDSEKGWAELAYSLIMHLVYMLLSDFVSLFQSSVGSYFCKINKVE